MQPAESKLDVPVRVARAFMNFMSTSASDLSAPPAARTSDGSAETPVVHEPVQETIIQPVRGWIGIDWGELARARELLYFLVWRDVKVRYKQAALGVLWSVLVPLVQVTIFTLIFSSGFSMASLLGEG